ncbi:pyridoxamine 5'-phosphate oxidase family protein [Aureimonas mangrovi]|uniref:pyridoxamine 5'-phosphate oxidase family protein n=1 Tax=Aureimonas mangrovi TaxID=2758041 RepID=UPI00163D9F77|nr:pyridoxamine 5'-phosphate oxidase family protein [Aureimonas mangrovi]
MTDNSPEAFWELVDGYDTCMVTTRDGNSLRARPMAPKVSKDRREILFVTDRSSHKVDEIEANPSVACAFAKHGEYLSVTGTARVSTDRALIDTAWDAEVEAWMPDGKDGPNVAILAVTPEAAEIWDVKTNKIARAYELAKAYLGDKDRPDVGDHAKVRL